MYLNCFLFFLFFSFFCSVKKRFRVDLSSLHFFEGRPVLYSLYNHYTVLEAVLSHPYPYPHHNQDSTGMSRTLNRTVYLL
jgi:hypothetical protein